MTENYGEVIRDRQVTIAECGGVVAGVLVLTVTDEGFLLHNVAVDPQYAGKGIGRALLELAEREARRQRFTSIYLYTHEKMAENLALYARIGYLEYARRDTAAGRQTSAASPHAVLVYMRKILS